MQYIGNDNTGTLILQHKNGYVQTQTCVVQAPYFSCQTPTQIVNHMSLLQQISPSNNHHQMCFCQKTTDKNCHSKVLPSPLAPLRIMYCCLLCAQSCLATWSACS
jgi:hypothetical protein